MPPQSKLHHSRRLKDCQLFAFAITPTEEEFATKELPMLITLKQIGYETYQAIMIAVDTTRAVNQIGIAFNT